MSGVEIAGLCFAGIAAYKCCHDLFSTWRKKRAKTKRGQDKNIASHSFFPEADDGLQLTRSLALGEPRIREEYDRDYRVLGQVFQTGDEIGRTQLQNVLNDLQIMVGTLHALVDHGVGGIERILGLSENSRVRAVSALADQFQRLAVRAPIGPALAPSAEGSSLSTPMRVNKSSLPENHAVALTTCPNLAFMDAESYATGPILHPDKLAQLMQAMQDDDKDWNKTIHKGDVVVILDEMYPLIKVKVVQCGLGNMSIQHLPPTGMFLDIFFSTTMVDPAPKGYAYSLLEINGKKAGDLYRVVDPEESPSTWRVRHVNTGERLSVHKMVLRT